MFEDRLARLKASMERGGIDTALITDDDSVYYFTGYFDYLHMEFGRPTILIVQRDDETTLITPSIDYNTALDSARVDQIEPWNDGVGAEWREHLPGALKGRGDGDWGCRGRVGASRHKAHIRGDFADF